MLSPKSPAPKLKGYGAEVRGLVPVALHLARELLDDGNVTESTVKRTIVELAACHSCLTETERFSPDRLADHSRRFETLYVELESRAPLAFRVKPAQQLIGLTARRTSAAVSRG